MKVVRVKSNWTNYYTGYNLGTFFNIPTLNHQINTKEIDIDLLNAAIYYCTNVERARLKIVICNFHRKLTDLSMLHSSQMKLHSFFSHENQYEYKYRNLENRLNTLKTESFNGFFCFGHGLENFSFFLQPI